MRRALITGAGRGIGRHTALALARHDHWHLVLLARSREELERVAREVRELGSSCDVVAVDLTGDGEPEAACAAALELLGGRLDLLVNNAGAFDLCDLADLERAFWDRMLELNLTVPAFATRACLPGLQASAVADRAPVVVQVASIAAEVGFPGNAAYGASKYGLRGLSDSLRAELEPTGIAVRTVYPGATDTSIFDDVEGDWDRATMDRPEDVAELIRRAAEPDAPNELRMYERP